ISIDWQNCSLCAISKEWLVPYQNQLLELDLSYNNLNILPSNIPWQMINLKSFVVMHSFLYGLSSPSETTPILCQSLEFINLSHNEMIYLPAELFYLRELKYLNVSHNCLQSLSTSKGYIMYNEIIFM
ncbi:hypothetical protein HELRODRAFT_64161, partial [Helobdella robusta]|uniref:LRRNT domain-containing protein n=1 Tax=Helobdella robusta TaxID=6412 RepID=T1FXQ6_HELRO